MLSLSSLVGDIPDAGRKGQCLWANQAWGPWALLSAVLGSLFLLNADALTVVPADFMTGPQVFLGMRAFKAASGSLANP